MNVHRWPDGTPRSQGNAFDLSKREHSIFFDPKRPPPKPTKKPSKASTSVVASVKGLSKRAQKQLSAAPKSITIGRPTDTEKRRKVKRARI